MVKGAWVTLATNDSYSLGALVLAHSLKQVGTQQELAVLVTPGVTNSMRARLSDVFNIVREVNVLDSRDKANLKLLQRPELGITFTKLHCWQLTEYEKCVFLDADTLVLQNCDELFEREELSAAPDVGWPDCFNSGVFVYRPSDETYNSLIQFALDKGSFDGGDQGLLNLYFADWARKDISKHLPFIYNVCSTAFYSYLPAFKQFGKDVKIIHFIGNAKPWLQYFDTESKKVRPSRDLGHLEPILQRWWNIFCSMIHPNLSPDMISSYPSDRVSARSPDLSLQQPYIAPPSPVECQSDIRPNFWDPWEEYDRNQMNVTLHSTDHSESHNTTALSSVATDHSCIDHPNPSIDVPFVDRHDQHNNDISTHVEYSDDGQAGIEVFSESNLKEEIFVENRCLPSNDRQEDIVPHANFETVPESLTTSPVPIHPQENCASVTSCEVSISDKIPNYSDSLPHGEIEKTVPEEKHIPVSNSPEEIPVVIPPIPEENPIPICPVPSKHETEEDSNNVPCEVESSEKESGLAGAFAKLTLGQQRTPEQEALEDSLRRQNWEQGNIDYLGKDSFDNIWSKICETLAKGPQDIKRAQPQVVLEDQQGNGQATKNFVIDDSTSPSSTSIGKQKSEGENTTQLKSDDLVLASPQLETCTPTKADVLSASQETPLTTSSLPTDQETLPSDPISASTPLVISSVEAPIGSDAIEKQASPKRDPSPQEKIPSENDPSAQENISSSKIEESSESKSVSIPAEQTTSETMKPLEEIPKSVVSGVEITSEKLPLVGKTLESANILVEQKTPEDISSVKETSKPEIDPIPTEPNSKGAQPDKQASEEKVPASPVAEVSVPSPEVPKQDIPKESAVSASQTVLSSQQALPTEHEASAPPQISPEVPVCPLKEAPPLGDIIPTSTIAEASPSEQIIQHETPASPNIALSEQSLTSEKSSCTLAKTAIPTEPPKPETVALEKILQPLSEEMAASPTTQNLPVKQEPEQVSSEKTLELSSPSEKKASPPPAETALPKETPAKPEQITPEKVPQPPSQTKEQVPTVPTQTEPSKPEQVSPQKISQPSSPSDEKVSPSKIQTAPVKPEPTQQEGSQSPVTSSQPASTPASQSANVAATSPVASSEPVPPITPPPRKSGGNKKQSKSKK